MKFKKLFPFVVSAFFLFASSTTFSQNDEMNYWMQWRGPLGTGAAVKGNPPVKFGENQTPFMPTEYFM